MSRTAVLPQKILALLEDAHFLNVAQILELLEKNGDKFNKTSVYRTLEKLQENDLVCKQIFGENEAKFELRSDHHDHAICTNCEKVILVECHTDLEQKIPGFHSNHHHTTIYGVCDSCLQKR